MAKAKKKIALVKNKKTNALSVEIKSQIEQARKHVSVVVNQSLTQLYWNIGRLILLHILNGNRAVYGNSILATVSQELSWSHFTELVTVETEAQRMFYAQMAIAERWSVCQLYKTITRI